jgi:hypothetical protein
MARIRSPNYPAISLAEAIKRIAQVHIRERQHPAAREVIMKGMGYSGVNGASLSALSAAIKYGLLEQKGKGQDYRVSDRAVAILHPHNPAEKAEALRAAARAPTLFGELLDHFKGGLPSDDNLRAYLVRRGFSQSSLTNVIQSFRDTIELVTPEPSEPDLSRGFDTPSTHDRLPSVPASEAPRERIQVHGPEEITSTHQSPAIRVSITDGRLEVMASLTEEKEIDKLIQILKLNKILFQTVEHPFDTGPKDDENDAAR